MKQMLLKNKEKGFTLVYTVIASVLIFSLCSIITVWSYTDSLTVNLNRNYHDKYLFFDRIGNSFYETSLNDSTNEEFISKISDFATVKDGKIIYKNDVFSYYIAFDSSFASLTVSKEATVLFIEIDKQNEKKILCWEYLQ